MIKFLKLTQLSTSFEFFVKKKQQKKNKQLHHATTYILFIWCFFENSFFC